MLRLIPYMYTCAGGWDVYLMEGLEGLSAFCSSELRYSVPTSPFLTGHSTWMSLIGDT